MSSHFTVIFSSLRRNKIGIYLYHNIWNLSTLLVMLVTGYVTLVTLLLRPYYICIMASFLITSKFIMVVTHDRLVYFIYKNILIFGSKILYNQFMGILLKSYVTTMRAEMPAFFIFFVFMKRSWKTKTCIFSFFLIILTVNYVFRFR